MINWQRPFQESRRNVSEVRGDAEGEISRNRSGTQAGADT
jgi:hypothetical protein